MPARTDHLVDDKYAFRDLVEIGILRRILERFSEATGLATGLESHPDGEGLIRTGWRDICTRFHRARPASAARCEANSARLAEGLARGEPLLVKACEHGLVDGAVAVLIKGTHVANLQAGQIFLEEPDRERFRQQAALYDYDEEAYLEALDRVPVLTEERFLASLRFLGETAALCGELGLSNLKLRTAAEQLGQEIDGRARVGSELRESEEKFATAFRINAALMAISTLDDGRFVEVNEAFLDTLGYERSEVIGRTSRELGLFADFAQRDAVAKAVRERGYARGFEITVRTNTGDLCYGLFSADLIHLHDVPHLLTVMSDITDRKRAEREREKLELQLRQSQKMEAVGRLAGGVAHDFNNILTGILGYAEMILATLGPADPLRPDIEEIHRAGERAADLTGQLLAFSRQQIISPRVVSLNDIVSQSNRLLRRIIGEDVELAFVPGKDLWSIRADPSQIDQVLVNLAVNARDAMPEGGRLTVETSNVTQIHEVTDAGLEWLSGDFVQLAVSDDGHGMDEHTRQLIFEPFFSTKGRDHGTGLGLSTVYGIVRQNGGYISVYSEPGVGTTFKIHFPRAEGAEEAVAEPVSTENATGTETVLLVEDEDLVRNLARKILEEHGYRVLEAAGPEEALRLCGDGGAEIDVLLTDVVMPTGNGRELYDRLSAKRPDLKVLFMSGYTENVIAHHGVLEKDTPFLQKPFTIESLVGRLREVLDA